MKTLRTSLAVGLAVAAMSAMAPQPPGTLSTLASGARDFDFLVGEWRVHHRRLTPAGHGWVEFEGTSSNRVLMGGAANMEEHALKAPAGAYRAIALRAYDSATREWAIWWLDGRYPAGPVGPPVKGRFENGVGRFYADYMQNGKAMRGRFLWSNITPSSARFEQSVSSDGGKTWAANWIMDFKRASPTHASTIADGPGVSDFDFLRGNWRVRHRYLRVKDNTREWLNADGTASYREQMNNRANLEEHTINAPGGPYRAVALRSYDVKAAQWSIWWLDGRAPHRPLDPPVQGRFENGVGTFHGDTTVDGKLTRVRFVWSESRPHRRAGNRPIRRMRERRGKRTGSWNFSALRRGGPRDRSCFDR